MPYNFNTQSGACAFNLACLEGQLEVAQLLYRVCPRVLQSGGLGVLPGDYAIHDACKGGNVTLVKWLASLPEASTNVTREVWVRCFRMVWACYSTNNIIIGCTMLSRTQPLRTRISLAHVHTLSHTLSPPYTISTCVFGWHAMRSTLCLKLAPSFLRIMDICLHLPLSRALARVCL